MMRGYFLQNLAEKMPLWTAALISGIIFALLNGANTGFNLRFALSALIISFLLVALWVVTGSLWTAIGWHAIWDWAQTTLFGMSVQGKEFSLFHVVLKGPAWLTGKAPAVEGGIIWIVIETLSLIALLALAKRMNGGRSMALEVKSRRYAGEIGGCPYFSTYFKAGLRTRRLLNFF